MTSLYGIVITDCIEQLPHNLTTLDITGCELSNDMQENLQVMLLLRVTMRGGGNKIGWALTWDFICLLLLSKYVKSEA